LLVTLLAILPTVLANEALTAFCTTEVAAANPSAAPIYGGASNGFGNIHVNSSTGDIFIYS